MHVFKLHCQHNVRHLKQLYFYSSIFANGKRFKKIGKSLLIHAKRSRNAYHTPHNRRHSQQIAEAKSECLEHFGFPKILRMNSFTLHSLFICSAFVIHLFNIHYTDAFTCCTLGLHDSPAIFQRSMSDLLAIC